MPYFSAVELASIAQIGYRVISLHCLSPMDANARLEWEACGLGTRSPPPETRKERASTK